MKFVLWKQKILDLHTAGMGNPSASLHNRPHVPSVPAGGGKTSAKKFLIMDRRIQKYRKE